MSLCHIDTGIFCHGLTFRCVHVAGFRPQQSAAEISRLTRHTRSCLAPHTILRRITIISPSGRVDSVHLLSHCSRSVYLPQPYSTSTYFRWQYQINVFGMAAASLCCRVSRSSEWIRVGRPSKSGDDGGGIRTTRVEGGRGSGEWCRVAVGGGSTTRPLDVRTDFHQQWWSGTH